MINPDGVLNFVWAQRDREPLRLRTTSEFITWTTPAADPPFVLMPGLTNNAHSFGGLIHAGLNKGRRVLTLGLRGRGLSGKTGTGDLLKPSLNRLDKVFPSWDAYLKLARGMPFIDGYWDQCIEDHYQADVEIRADGSVKPRTPPVLPSKNAMETAKALPNGRYVRVPRQPSDDDPWRKRNKRWSRK